MPVLPRPLPLVSVHYIVVQSNEGYGIYLILIPTGFCAAGRLPIGHVAF